MQRLEIKQKQTQKLKQQLRQSLAVLSMTGEDLAELVEREVLENPLLEKVAPVSEEFEANWLGYKGVRKTSESVDPLLLTAATQNITALLEEQFALVATGDREKKLAEYIIGSLDDSGFLPRASLELLCDNFTLDPQELESVRQKVLNLSPGGFGSANVVEYLAWQVGESDKPAELKQLANLILQEHLSLLVEDDPECLAQMLGESVETVRSAMAFIRSLSPRPANTVSNERVVHITPDLVIYRQAGEFLLALNPYFYPLLNVTADYREGLEVVDKETNRYLNAKLRAANFFRYCILQREETMRKIGGILIKLQRDFLQHGLLNMRPLRLKDVADLAEIHESTVSRAISGKYAQTPHGTIPLKYFFPSEIKTVGTVSFTPAQIKRKICEFIRDAKKRPSDRLIAEMLRQQGIVIARRTVTKYREQLGIK